MGSESYDLDDKVRDMAADGCSVDTIAQLLGITPAEATRHLEPVQRQANTWDVQQCTACEAPIIFAVSASTGSMMPINAMPSADGNIVLRPGPTSAPVATVLGPAKRFGLTGLRTSHFATCPRAAKFRKRGRS